MQLQLLLLKEIVKARTPDRVLDATATFMTILQHPCCTLNATDSLNLVCSALHDAEQLRAVSVVLRRIRGTEIQAPMLDTANAAIDMPEGHQLHQQLTAVLMAPELVAAAAAAKQRVATAKSFMKTDN